MGILSPILELPCFEGAVHCFFCLLRHFDHDVLGVGVFLRLFLL